MIPVWPILIFFLRCPRAGRAEAKAAPSPAVFRKSRRSMSPVVHASLQIIQLAFESTHSEGQAAGIGGVAGWFDLRSIALSRTTSARRF